MATRPAVGIDAARHVTQIGVLSALEKPLHPDPCYLDAAQPHAADLTKLSQRHRERVVKYINEVRARAPRPRASPGQ